MQREEKMPKIINGKDLSKTIKENLKIKVEEFEKKYCRKITVAVVLVGDNPASQLYVKNKIKSAQEVGIKSLAFYLPKEASFNDVKDVVESLGKDDAVDGILVQLPLPKSIDERKILELIPVDKDVDGFCEANLGNLLLNKDCIVSCTPLGIIRMLESIDYDFEGKNAVVIGRSNIVGKPISLLLLHKNCTVTICHSKTKNLKKITKKADLIIAALGKPKFVTKDMVKKGVCIIDVGINRTEQGIIGDVDFKGVFKKVSAISPVPKGVGPMTITMLMENTYKCALLREKAKQLKD